MEHRIPKSFWAIGDAGPYARFAVFAVGAAISHPHTPAVSVGTVVFVGGPSGRPAPTRACFIAGGCAADPGVPYRTVADGTGKRMTCIGTTGKTTAAFRLGSLYYVNRHRPRKNLKLKMDKIQLKINNQKEKIA